IEEYYVVPPACPPPPHNPKTLKYVPKLNRTQIIARVYEAKTPTELENSALGKKFFSEFAAVAKLVRLSQLRRANVYNSRDDAMCVSIYNTSVRVADKLLHLSSDEELCGLIWALSQLPYPEYENLVDRSLQILLEEDKPLKTGSSLAVSRAAAGLASLGRWDASTWEVLVPLLRKNVQEGKEVELSNLALGLYDARETV
uniref:mL120 n=1 Tax=Polytomella magna TaxID=353565 RepID=UPI002240E449|nr:Chain Xa, mL120 [Polytomella magna]8APN_Xa Chain Xa, mL120 [Polytomella magna]8APO_Xa Chain Xa, mL120 [Polytomella magna]